MRIKDNPFCILNIPSTANRQEIIAAAERMGKEKGKEVCAEACSKLLDPICRFEAEMDWFLDETLEGQRYLSDCIYARLPIPEMGQNTLSELNTILYKLEISFPLDAELAQIAMKADDCVKQLDITQLLQLINKSRQQAGIKEATLMEVMAAVNIKKNDVMRMVCHAIFTRDFLEYLAVVTYITDEYITRVNTAGKAGLYGEVIAAVLSEYDSITELDRKLAGSDLDASLVGILDDVQNAEDIDQQIKHLEVAKKTVDVYNFPLQIKVDSFAAARELKETTDRKIAGLAEKLNKQYGRPWEAIRLMGMMRKNPVDELIPPGPLENTGIIPKNSQQTEENTIQIVDKLIQLDKLGASLKQQPNESSMSEFTKNAEALNLYIKALRNETEFARYITRELDRLLLDMAGFFSSTGNKAYEDRVNNVLKQVTKELGLPQKGEYIPRQSGETDSKKTGCGTWIIALLAGVAIFALLIFVSVSF